MTTPVPIDSIQSSETDNWEKFGLLEYGDFADRTTSYEQTDDSGSWYWADTTQTYLYDGQPVWVIYGGEWNNYASPGATYWAEMYESEADFLAEIARLKGLPEYAEADNPFDTDDELPHDEFGNYDPLGNF